MYRHKKRAKAEEIFQENIDNATRYGSGFTARGSVLIQRGHYPTDAEWQRLRDEYSVCLQRIDRWLKSEKEPNQFRLIVGSLKRLAKLNR